MDVVFNSINIRDLLSSPNLDVSSPLTAPDLRLLIAVSMSVPSISSPMSINTFSLTTMTSPTSSPNGMEEKGEPVVYGLLRKEWVTECFEEIQEVLMRLMEEKTVRFEQKSSVVCVKFQLALDES